MPRVMHKRFKSYSGPAIYGTKLDEPTGDMSHHVDRAVYLTEAVETGRREGSVFCADGTAWTGGRGQHILVYPKELAHEDWNAKDDQGGLGTLLRRIEVEVGGPAVEALFVAFKEEGWYLAQDGKIRWLEVGRAKVANRWMEHRAGDLVHGAVLRDTLTPKGGKVPAKGPRWEKAKRWALLLHGVLVGDESMEVQRQFEVDHLVGRVITRRVKLSNTVRKTLQRALYGPQGVRELRAGKDITLELDLALCVFHSHSVNAPAIAHRKLGQALETVGPVVPLGNPDAEEALAREILRRLATATYGRWNEDVENGRWQRSRARARESGLWPRELFRAWPQGVMAADMP